MFLRAFFFIAAIMIAAPGGFFGVRKIMDFGVARSEYQGLGEEARVQRGFIPLSQWGERATQSREVSGGDFVVSSGIIVFNDTEFLQSGNIIVEDTGKLIFRNSVVKMSPSEEDKRVNILVRDNGEIIFENSTLKSGAADPASFKVNLFNEAKFVFRNSQGAHLITAEDSASVEMENSTWAFYSPTFMGGAIDVNDKARVKISNSVIGGLVLNLPEEAELNIRGFKAGKFENFEMQKDFDMRNVEFSVILENTEILSDYYPNNDRGLGIIVPSSIKNFKVADSILNKIVIESTDEDLTFDYLKLNDPIDLVYKNISITNSKVMSQWGFSMDGGSGTYKNSEGLWFALSNGVDLRLRDSEMIRFDAVDFTGTLDFRNVIWKNGGEVIDSNFTWNGVWFAQGFGFDSIIWVNSKIKRRFTIDILSIDPGAPGGREPIFVSAARITVLNGNRMISQTNTDKKGYAYFEIVFHDKNFSNNFEIKVDKYSKEVRYFIDFLTPTPIKLILK